MNFKVIQQNGGMMPVKGVFLPDSETHFGYENNDEVKKWYFSDFIRVENMYFSIGDILLTIGLLMFITTLGVDVVKSWGKNK